MYLVLAPQNIKGWIVLVLMMAFLGCAGAQGFVQQSGAAYKRAEQIEWTDSPSAEASNWTTYMDMEGG